MDNNKIKQYLSNQLSQEERIAFEKEMENDFFLQESMDGFKAIQNEFTVDEIEKLEQELHQLIDKKTSQQKTKNGNFNNFLKFCVAACIVGIVVLLGNAIYKNANTLNTDKIFATYYKPLTHPDGTVRGENDISDEQKAIEAYEKEDYFAAVNLYQSLVSNNPENAKNKLFLGISLLATNQETKAIEVFNSITNAETYQTDIYWYRALANIKNKDISAAEMDLQKLANSENFYQKNAQEILEKIGNKVALKD
ncbi:MAG: tetratricopeptide repeat protein [Chitinophagales bacterium]|nr:tetratricopeptide repeat protein [Bacteroidota bacterium]